MNFETMVTEGEIAHDEQFLLLPQYFQLYSMIKLLFLEVNHITNQGFLKSPAADLLCMEKDKRKIQLSFFAYIFSKSSAADFLYTGKI